MSLRRIVAIMLVLMAPAAAISADMKTWDGRHSIEEIGVTMVYFVPADRTPLPDWKQRLEYFANRIETFHAREYDGQSTLQVTIRQKPFVSKRTTAKLREGDGNDIFFRTLREVAEGIHFPKKSGTAFPILLVLSDINWRPLNDFYRVSPTKDGFEFEGQFIRGYHHPGAAAGGARATYLAKRGQGWGLVSADGWRVPYRGSDCVIYHEGVGHTVGLPHPQPGDGSVMSLAQYKGWISESWIKESQKRRLGWQPTENTENDKFRLFSEFRALPSPKVPHPGEKVVLECDWPEKTELKSLEVALQTDLWKPWRSISIPQTAKTPAKISLGEFETETPVSYRVRATTTDGKSVELWGYFQVRENPNKPLIPSPEQVLEQDRTMFESASETE